MKLRWKNRRRDKSKAKIEEDGVVSPPCAAIISVLDFSSEAAAILHPDGTIYYMNAVAERMFEISGDSDDADDLDLSASSIFSFRDERAEGNGHSENARKWEDVIRGGIKNPTLLDAIGVKRTGDTFPIAVTLTKVSGWSRKDGSAADEEVICAQIRDRTSVHEQMRNLEKEVRRLNRIQKALVKASEDSTIIVDEDGIIQSVDEVTLKQFGYARGELVGKNINILMNSNHSTKHDAYMKSYLKTGIMRVIGKRRELDARRKDGTVFPIELGVAEIESDEGEKRMFAGMICNISQRKEAHEKLEKNVRLTHGLIEASFDAVFAICEGGVIDMVNQAAINQFGWSREELIGQNISMVVGGRHQEKHDHYIKRYLQTGEKRVMGKKRELVARRKDGTEFPIELGLTEVQSEEGDVRRFCGFIKDLTKQKAFEAEIKRKQSLTMGIVDAAFEAMFAINERGIIEMVNEMAVTKFGWSREELIGQNVSMVTGGHHTAKHDGYIQRFLQTGEKRAMGKMRELVARRKDGSEFPIELGLVEVKSEEGEERRFCGFIKDLTRRKAYEAELRRKQSLTAAFIDTSFNAMFNINEKCIIQMANEAAIKQFGWKREELIGQNISVIVGGHHAKNHDKYVKHYLETGETRVMGKNRELVAKRKDGSEFPIELGLTEVTTHNGEERQFCGFIRDLTSQKQFEKDLKLKEAITKGIIEASFDAMFAIDEKGVIQMVNGCATREFGWSTEEFIGSNISMIVAEEHAEKHDEYIQNYLATGKTKVMGKRRHLEARKRDGSTFPCLLGVTEVEYEGEHSKLFAAFVHNMSELNKVKDMEIENAKAEALLLNMLPEEIAMRLKDEKGHIADHYSNVAILFADIVGFTKMSSRMTPVEVVAMLNELFSMFDEIVEKYDLNKVKTIGDCYMVTSHPGVESEKNECSHMCAFGLEMIEALRKYNKRNPHHELDLRVGINIGPVVAGVVGTKRFLYDLWGDSVNLASRMESTGIPGKIQVTKDVCDFSKDEFKFESRGIVQVKGKGEMETFILTGPKKAMPKLVPNSRRSSPAVLKTGRSALMTSLRNMRTSRKILETKIDELQSYLEDSEEE